ncbi:zinc finger protein 569-like [Melitaea cinxia]|uniref:zinc finger protein 569-like n=1 Tax=Melitaea cinxia TaxID=113334 RepID=UPI001E2739F6|nr:zinc finger protein 569-like [Melitaea cinxia]
MLKEAMNSMYESCGGDITNSNEMENSQSKLFEAEYVDYDDDPSAELFRGFEKVPIVLCQRIDITPYLKRISSSTPDVNINTTCENSKMVNKLLRKCSVVLLRDDLDKLKEMSVLPPNSVSCFKCKICNKTYSNEKKLQNHQENKHIVYKKHDKIPKRVSFSDHVVVHEVKEYHSCRKCPKIFEDYETLKIHMKRKHKKRKCYICCYCAKGFADRTLMKVHIKLHCDSCGLLLASKKKYSEHRRYVCRIIKKYECRTCSLSFFNYMDLKDHSYDHLGTFFICDICKDQFASKCEVAHHIKFLHTKKQTDELYSKQILGIDNVYKCNFCQESSDDVDIIEKHVSTLPDLQNIAMTGYDDYYFCDQCLKKFSTETDMLQHKWTHFLNTSDNSKLKQNIVKTSYQVGEELPALLQPKLVLEKLELPEEPNKRLKALLEKDSLKGHCQDVPIETHLIDSNRLNLIEIPKKPVIDPLTKKTLISKHQCEKCFKYFSSRYCLNRHLQCVHGVVKETGKPSGNNLQCNVCEEFFVWPSLLQNHKCIRINRPEMPFDDARPEVHFDNYIEGNENALNSMDTADDDYTNGLDFEIAAPIVQLTEYEDLNIVVNGGDGQLNIINNKACPLSNEKTINNLGYRLVMQEVPIEF